MIKAHNKHGTYWDDQLLISSNKEAPLIKFPIRGRAPTGRNKYRIVDRVKLPDKEEICLKMKVIMTELLKE